MKKIIASLFIIFQLAANIYAQSDMLSAKDLLQNLSGLFQSKVKDFEADITWSQDNTVSKGKIQFKNPQKVKISITSPSEQVICTNGYNLWVYISSLNIVFKQELIQKEKVKDSSVKSQTVVNPLYINPVGYDRFLTEYSVDFNETKNKIDYKDGSKVYTFKLLRWKSSKTGINTVILTVSDDGLMKKVEGITVSGRKISMEMSSYKLNNGFSDMVFDYDPPAHANTVDNFINGQE